MIEFLGGPGLLGSWSGSRAGSRGGGEEMGSRGRRNRWSGEGEDGRLEVLCGMWISIRVVCNVGEDGQNLRPLAWSRLTGRRARSGGRDGG